jgi:OOP family OmpA-OmpF porin
MKTTARFAAAAVAATVLFPAAVMAAPQEANNQGYVIENNGGAIVTSGYGLCWHDSEWTSARAVEPCDLINKPVAAVAPTPVAAVPTAAVIAAAPPSPPPAAVQPVPVKPLPQTIHFSGDALFAFDKAVLKPEGKTMLDGLVRQLDGATYDTILVTGYTDRIGTAAYNQKLSERRAQAVKDYLVSKDVHVGRIEAEGRGKTQPVTNAGDCRGAKSTKVIACLQPDRRVDVQMTGSRTVASSL